MTDNSFSELEENLSYLFTDKSLIEKALRHRSFVHEQPEPMESNERLEFLGDAVLNLIVSHILMERFPGLNEGDLSRLRASLVNENRLAAVAESIGVGGFLKLGKGEHLSSGREKKSILADALEALIAAIYLDSGLEHAAEIIHRHFSAHFDAIAGTRPVYDYKSRLQEFVQEKSQQMPVYEVTGESGPDHDKTFRVTVIADDLRAEGSGKSKKTAEQDAARAALDQLKDH